MRYFKFAGVKQHDMTDCAAACISSVAQWYGLHVPLITIREICGSNKQGTSIKGIIDGCQMLGLTAVAMKSTDKNFEDLKDITTPSILHFNNETGLHFVLLCGFDKGNFIIMDPAIGKRTKISEIELTSFWSGYIIFIEPNKNFKKGNSTKSSFSQLLPILKRNKSELAKAILFSIFYILVGISLSLFIEYIIDFVIPSKNYLKIISVTVLMGILFTSSFIIEFLRIKNLIKVGYDIDYSLINSYLQHLFRLPISFFSLRGSGELNSRISDAFSIREFITTGVINLLISAFTLIISFILMFSFYWKLALITLSFLPIYVSIYTIANKINKRINRKIIESSALFEEKAIEGISTIATIKYNGYEKSVLNNIRKEYLEFSNNLYRGGKYNALFNLSTDIITKISILCILTTGSLFILKGELMVGELVSFYSMLTFISTPLIELVGINNTFSEAKISAQRLFEILDYQGEDFSGEEIVINKIFSIVFKNIGFGYPGNFPLFKNFNATLKSGEITAITGKNGCGKSTIASLLMRSLQPTTGNILLDDYEINLLNLEQWRNFIAIVPQDSPLMNATILDNITGWSKKPNLNKVAKLISDLGMSEFIKKLPNGVLTQIGERGAILSGGQKQRISFARALYKDPKVIILDEATSSLDLESETFILEKIIELKHQGCMIIMITHKDNNIKIADNVIHIEALQAGDFCTP